MARKIAVVTGSSGGIGFELARLLAKGGRDLVIVATKKDELAQASKELKSLGAGVWTFQMDLSKPDSATELFGELEALESGLGLEIDVLVNNAGFGLYGMFKDTDIAAEERMMTLNMVTLTKLTKLLLKGMLKRGRGRILNVASTAAFQPGPLMAVYYATKAYALSFSEAIAEELEGTGVAVTALCPGPTRSGFQGRAGMGGSKIIKGKLMSAESVAKAGYAGLMEGRRVVIPGLKNKLFAYSARVGPRKMVTKIVRRMQEAGP